jgi:small subunit ribosomal protein S1
MKVGDEIMTYVVSPEDGNGNIVLSLSRAQTEKDWHEAEELFKTQNVFEGQVAGFNKGGLIVKVGKVRGFVPASQLVTAPGGKPEAEGGEAEESKADKQWQPLVGKKLQLKVIEMDRARNRLILSERAAMRDWRKVQKEKLLSELHVGMHLKGKVISLADFGAFVDLGGADGLVHLSEISWKRVTHPKEVLKVGQEVEVEVLNVDHDRKRIGLSLKRLEADPWSTIENRYKIGQLIEGTITKLAKFGAFARIKDDDEIEGLIHISELSDGRINHPKEVVKEGQVVTLRVIRIDADKRRLGLSLKRVDQAEYAESDWRQGLQEAWDDVSPEITAAEA